MATRVESTHEKKLTESAASVLPARAEKALPVRPARQR